MFSFILNINFKVLNVNSKRRGFWYKKYKHINLTIKRNFMKKPLIVVKNEATICGLSRELTNLVKKYLTISNPLFEKRIELGLASWGCPPQLQYFTKSEDSIKVPVGALSQILTILKENGVDITPKDIKDLRRDKDLKEYFSKVDFIACLETSPGGSDFITTFFISIGPLIAIDKSILT